MRLISFLLFMFCASFVRADQMGQGRLYLGGTTVNPTDLNSQLTAQSIKEVKLVNQYGVEITFPTFDVLQAGLRYSKHMVSLDEQPSSGATDYKVDLDQDVILGIVRWPFFKNDNVYLDVFGGLGASKATYKIKSASAEGGLEQGTAPNYLAGASIAVGFKKFYFVVESGFEGNKLDHLDQSGNLNSTMTSIDMSGPYVLIGLMFDGIPIFKK